MEAPPRLREFLPIISPKQARCGMSRLSLGALQQQNYRWWIERLRTALARVDVNRLDHFIGFVRTYEVPAQALTAMNGQYQPGGGAPFSKPPAKHLVHCL